MKSKKGFVFLGVFSLSIMTFVPPLFAASSATFVFDFLTDPYDVADGPDYIVTATDPIDDNGTSCDMMVMIMVDATGTVTDIDTFCVDTTSGTGGSDGDYGSFGSGYLPTAGPATYALFDLTATDLAALLGLGDSDPAYYDYVVANATLLAEGYADVNGLTSGTPYSFFPTPPVVVSPDGTVSFPPPPPTPLCEEHNSSEGGVVRSSIADANGFAVNCRVLYQNGRPASYNGGALYDFSSIGVPGILELGVQQAVDIFSPSGQNYFTGGAVFCLRGTGTLIWLAASQMPRHPEIIGSYTVPDWEGFTCATLFEPGTLVLVSQTPQ